MTVDQQLEAALGRIAALARSRSLREVEAGSSEGTPALQVRGSAFVHLADADTLVLQCPIEQKALLLEMSPQSYFETDHYVGHPAVLVRLSAVSDEELALRLEDAWRHKAPQSLRDALPLASNPTE